MNFSEIEKLVRSEPGLKYVDLSLLKRAIQEPHVQGTFNRIMNRISEVTGAETYADLARVLGFSYSYIVAVLRKRKIPESWILKVVEKFWINPAWLRYGGEIPRYIVPSKTPIFKYRDKKR